MLALAVGGLLLTLSALLMTLGQAAVAASRAATAADLAALAGADAARGLAPGDPCPVAADVAARNGAALVSCGVSGPDGSIVEVRTRLAVPWPPGAARGRARAGPPPDAASGQPGVAAPRHVVWKSGRAA